MASNLQDFANQARARLESTNSSAARSFLYRHGYNSSSFVLPEFYKPSGFSEMELDPIVWKKHGPRNLHSSQPIELVAPKGPVGWRRFSILHPYTYWHIVNSLTASDAWPIIRCKLSQPTRVASYTLPTFRLSEKTSQGAGIKAWLRFAETDLIADGPRFSHLGLADIQNFYPSIYTHSLAWAIDGRDRIKANQRDTLNFVGNRIDRLFQSAHGNQTNGIPIGTMVSDIISELLLVDVDAKISSVLNSPDVLMARYRDDYRILATDHDIAKTVIGHLSKSLHQDYDLTLNNEKTKIESDIVTAAFRPWARAAAGSVAIREVVEGDKKIQGHVIKNALLEIYALQHQYLGSNVAISQLQKINGTLEKSGRSLSIRTDDLRSCIGILRMLMHVREEAAPHVMILADKLFTKFGDNVVKPLVKSMITEDASVQGNDFMEIWLYRLAMHRYPKIAAKVLSTTTNPLLKMVSMQRPHVEEFPVIERLIQSDKNALTQFSYIDTSILDQTASNPLTASIASPWNSTYE